MPEIGLCAPGLDRQSPADADEDDQQVSLEIRLADDRDGHESKNAKQQPVDVAPPGAVPVYIRQILLCQWPPDVHDQENGHQKPAQQDAAVAGPQSGGGADV